ncbi:MAG: DUF192 domain-containing protein [Candidatus Roizmanbacteria bacterium]|nr:DUF192 domain-containing protein [Candidatus Roizmanbacteria bacterium]
MKRRIVLLLGTVLAIVAVFATKGNKNNIQTLTIGSHTFAVTIADTDKKREQGLSNNTTLGNDEGMYFIFSTPDSYTFWMKDMQYDLDFIYIKDNTVVNNITDIPSPAHNNGEIAIVNSPVAFDGVVEVRSGFIKRWNIQKGQKVALEK